MTPLDVGIAVTLASLVLATTVLMIEDITRSWWR